MNKVKLKDVALGNGWTANMPATYSVFREIESKQNYTVLDDEYDSILILEFTETSVEIHGSTYDSHPIIDFKNNKVIVNFNKDHFAD